jgi:hypothetical protein
MSDPATKEDLKDLREFILITPTPAPTPSIEQSIYGQPKIGNAFTTAH